MHMKNNNGRVANTLQTLNDDGAAAAPGLLSRRQVFAGLGAAAVMGPGLLLPSGEAEAAAQNLFGYSEKRHKSLKPFIKWTGTLDRYFSEQKLESQSCKSQAFNKCHLQRWKEFLTHIEGESTTSQIQQINAQMNAARYTLDPINYGVSDYWATPKQFFVKNGDCEDYAITKYLSLRALGFPKNQMRLVVLMDQNLRLAHAILAVYYKDDILVLDNQINRVISHRRIKHYRPVYSLAEDYWWSHKRG